MDMKIWATIATAGLIACLAVAFGFVIVGAWVVANVLKVVM